METVTDVVEPTVLLAGRPDAVDSTAAALRESRPATDVMTATSRDRAETLVGEDEIDCVVCDEELSDTDGISVLYAIREEHRSLPVVLYAGDGSEELASEAISAGVTDYVPLSLTDEQPAVLANRIRNAVEKYRAETALKARGRRLAAINQLHRVLQDITTSVIETPTRDEMEQRVCDRLVESDTYAAAWFGDFDRGTNAVTLSASAGESCERLNELARQDGDDGHEPATQAVRSKEIQLVSELDDGGDERWREAALECGYRSLASIPITHRRSLYGVLTIYSKRSGAFRGHEDDILETLGNVLGHAFEAFQRKQTLMSDVLTELELRLPELETPLVDAAAGEDYTIRVDRTLPAGDDEYVQYLTADGLDTDAVERLADAVDSIERISPVGAGEEFHQFEVTQTAPPLTGTIATFGGRVRSATVRNGECHAVVELPSDVDVRSLLEALRERFPEAELVAQRTVEQDSVTTGEFRSRVFEELTEKQRTALEAAYFSGFFEWPRDNSGEEIAETLGVAPATFSQHIRNAERKIADVLLKHEREDRSEE
ncbi:Response regulator receiver domain-containing protein [Natronoarchaeum philippinense]|uniref:Response regulator receiver domain-containing protein n=1 Tax=Natronoarchaeum philippinense TaxID=558529 RepID=A0A285P8L0_NATPI|nr:bacterio-opsin activator domain-containing protein [Natronoarchaeum philippinense]SNZ16221.1 Response regulator receiver domain-containing protein [Natronoarchaeum philippinense]